MEYGDILGTAWDVVKRYKVLWLFGLLAALGGGGFNFTWNIGTQNQTLFELPLGTRALLRYVFHLPDLSNTLLMTGLVLGVVVFAIHTLATGALIDLVGALERHQPLTVRHGLHAGWRFWGPLLVMRLILAVPLLIAGRLVLGDLLPALSSFFSAPIGERLLPLGLVERMSGGGVLLIGVGLIVAAISLGAARAIVLSGQSVVSALVTGVRLLVVQLRSYLVLTGLFVVLGLAISILFVVILMPIAFLTMLPSIGPGGVSGLDVFMFTGDNFGPMLILITIESIIFGTFTTAFASAVWTLAYEQWQTPRRLVTAEPSKLDSDSLPQESLS